MQHTKPKSSTLITKTATSNNLSCVMVHASGQLSHPAVPQHLPGVLTAFHPGRLIPWWLVPKVGDSVGGVTSGSVGVLVSSSRCGMLLWEQ